MPKGHKPKTSEDPSEERMITWRMKGGLHKRLVAIAQSQGLSLNAFITRAVRQSLDEIEERISNRKGKDK
jgi:predicted HicB family RNase H-like nuclease